MKIYAAQRFGQFSLRFFPSIKEIIEEKKRTRKRFVNSSIWIIRNYKIFLDYRNCFSLAILFFFFFLQSDISVDLSIITVPNFCFFFCHFWVRLVIWRPFLPWPQPLNSWLSTSCALRSRSREKLICVKFVALLWEQKKLKPAIRR